MFKHTKNQEQRNWSIYNDAPELIDLLGEFQALLSGV